MPAQQSESAEQDDPCTPTEAGLLGQTVCSRVPDACPLADIAQPRMCLFAEVLNSANLGVVMLDMLRQRLLFRNVTAAAVLKSIGAAEDYAALHERLIARLPEPWPVPPAYPPPICHEGRLVGYSLYRVGDYAWAFVRDITEKARLEAIAEAVEQMSNIGYVFTTVRHEIGNPVNSVKTALAVLRSNLSRFEPRTVQAYLDRALTELARVEDLLASLKSFSMYEDVQPVEQEVAPVLLRTVSLVAPEFERRGVAVALHFDPQAAMASFDARALQQVLLNLLTNAADAVEACASKQVRVMTAGLPGFLAIRVEDNGCGLSDAQKQRLFKPFSSTKAQGTGLGLVIAKKMTVKMAGTLDVESAAGRGTTVTLTLPRCGTPRLGTVRSHASEARECRVPVAAPTAPTLGR